MNIAITASHAWQHLVQDLSAHPMALFPQEPSEATPPAPDFDALLAQSQLLARAMGRVVRVNPDRTLDVVARVSHAAAINAYKGLRV